MGWNIGIPSLKLNNVGKKSKHCGSFAGVAMEALEERKGRDPDIDPELAHLNIYEGITSAKELMAYSQQHVQELSDQQRAVGGRKIRDDAVVMCSTIIKPPAEMMEGMSRDDQIRFLQDATEKLSEIVGSGNVKSKAFHFDEQGGHAHVLWEPITEDGRLCAKELHNVKFFGRLNREMPEYLRKRGWDIEDCQAYDAAKDDLEQNEDRKERKKSGRSSAVYKRDMERKIEVMEQTSDQLQQQVKEQEKRYIKIVEANDENSKIIEENNKIIEKQDEIIAEQREILYLIQDYDEYRDEAAQLDKDLNLMEEAYKELPAARKLFLPAAAESWLEKMTQILYDIRRLIEAGIRRLKIFEKDYGVDEPLSVPVEKRKMDLDTKIFGASKTAQEAAEKGQIRPTNGQER